MSAWIVGKLHIDVMVQALQQGEIVVDRSADEVGRALWGENLASVTGRYPNDGDGDRPGPNDFRDADVSDYVYEAPTKERLAQSYNPAHYALPGDYELTPVVLLKVFGCYDYQSCEHREYADSEAAHWVKLMESNLIRSGASREGAEYRRAPWGLS